MGQSESKSGPELRLTNTTLLVLEVAPPFCRWAGRPCRALRC